MKHPFATHRYHKAETTNNHVFSFLRNQQRTSMCAHQSYLLFFLDSDSTKVQKQAPIAKPEKAAQDLAGAEPLHRKEQVHSASVNPEHAILCAPSRPGSSDYMAAQVIWAETGSNEKPLVANICDSKNPFTSVISCSRALSSSFL